MSPRGTERERESESGSLVDDSDNLDLNNDYNSFVWFNLLILN